MDERPISTETAQPSEPADRDARLHDLLVKTSRTFALAIPQLPQPTLREVTIAYLLFRIADTFEDASVLWDRPQRLAALKEFDHLLDSPSVERAQRCVREWSREPPTDHAGYLELLEETPLVFAALLALDEPSRTAIVEHTGRTAQLMAEFVAHTDGAGVLRLRDLDDLRAYCYAVAGIVGEMLTDLFLLGSDSLAASAEFLRKRASAFGEGLQLVNILKDSASDEGEGRNFLPSTVDRGEVFALARTDLQAATEYSRELQRAGAPAGVVAFTALPVELAWATLDLVEERGPGAKITRERVFALYAQVHQAIEEGRPVLESRRSAPQSS
ncbi:MAG: squalene/phytoene synthase family protein [bacterium]|nr:squalene/phytoene synthase family protein [bacterium]